MTTEHLHEAKKAWDALDGASLEPLGGGLINETFLATPPVGARLVVQRVSAIFDPAIHDNIRAVTERLAQRGMTTPRLLPTRSGDLALDLGDDGLWRVMTYVEGATFGRAIDAGQIEAAAHLVGRFHATLDDLDHEFVGRRLGVHDTEKHLEALRDALDASTGHRLRVEVLPIGKEILERAAALPPLPALSDRVCHGDPKLDNVRFAGTEAPDHRRALCLIDLDTVGPMSLAHELGDAWRSWCNTAGEDTTTARFDLETFEASLRGYVAGVGRPLSVDERLAALLGVEWVSLELSARFAADAIRESYFGYDVSRFPASGEHNLLRARGQLSLHRAVVETRARRESLLALSRSR